MAEPKPKKETLIELDFIKSTKGTHVYANADQGMSNVYFPHALPIFEGLEKPPTTVEMVLRIKK